jgi:hypothetical protein
MREFAVNRANKVGEIFDSLKKLESRLQIPEQPTIPILDGLEESAAMIARRREAEVAVKEYKGAVREALKTVQSWSADDPTFTMYRGVFNKEVVVSASEEIDDLVRMAEERYRLKLPPGYKDSGKVDGGIGDFLIWKAILSLGASRKKSLLFISGDDKADWWHRSNDIPLFPRVELIDEYRRASGGKAFRIASLSRLLELHDVKADIVEAIRAQEAEDRRPIRRVLECPYSSNEFTYAFRDVQPITGMPVCPFCNRHFHAHIHGDEVVCRARNQKKSFDINADMHEARQLVVCSSCGFPNRIIGKMAHGDMKIQMCDECDRQMMCVSTDSGIVDM